MGTPVQDPVEFGNRIRAVRGFLQMSRDKFSALTGISRAKIQRIEEGQVGKRGWSELEKRGLAELLAEETGLPREWFDEGAPWPASVSAEQLQDGLERGRSMLELMKPTSRSLEREAKAALDDLDQYDDEDKRRRGEGG